LYGLAIGGMFALAFAALRGRVGPRSDGALALAAAGTAFAALIVVPFLQYPANPPPVGDPGTITGRPLLYPALAGAGPLSAAAPLFVVPFLKYPANPPAVGDPDTITGRTLLYLAMVGVGLLAAAAAVTAARRVPGGPWARGSAAVLAFLAPVVAAWLALPGV